MARINLFETLAMDCCSKLCFDGGVRRWRMMGDHERDQRCKMIK